MLQRLTINVLILNLCAPLNAGGCWSAPGDGPAQPAPRVVPVANTVNVTVNNVTKVIKVAAVTQVAHQTTQTNIATNLSSLPGIRGEPKEANESKQVVVPVEEYKKILLAAETAKKDLNEQDKKRLHVLYQEMSAPERSVIGQQYLAFQLNMTQRAQQQANKLTAKKPRGRGQRTGSQQRPSLKKQEQPKKQQQPKRGGRGRRGRGRGKTAFTQEKR